MTVHIGDVLLKDGKPTGQMKALCGAVVTSVLAKGTSRTGRDMCPACIALNTHEKGTPRNGLDN